MREILITIINNSQGIKATDLALKIYEQVHPKAYSSDNIMTILDNLVEEGEIVELTYVLPQMNYREKSIYFPKGTELKWKRK